MNKPISYLTVMPSNKREIKIFADSCINEILSGNINPLDVDLQLKCLEELIKVIRSNNDVKDCVISEIKKHGGNIKYKDANISIIEAGVKYDYSKCGDSVLNDLTIKISQLSEIKKGRENWLKSLNCATPDVETGEICYPPVKTSTTTLKYSL